MDKILKHLFVEAQPPDPVSSHSLFVLRKSDLPFLLLPANPAKAMHAMSLYPAQTTKAKLFRSLVRWSFLTRFPLPFKKIDLTLSPNDPFARFLQIQSGLTNLPEFAVLAGNPHTRGRRFIILVFGRDDQPSAVVKVGVGSEAMELIEREKAFLKAVPKSAKKVPDLRGDFEAPHLTAFAMDFLGGDSPRRENDAAISELLSSWIDVSSTLTLNKIPAWVRLRSVCEKSSLYLALDGLFSTCPVHPVIYHGDFAPWNVKVSRDTGDWSVLDWERGELTGMPAWDWFHFYIQRKILVSQLPAATIARDMAEWLATPAFQQYAAVTGIEKVIRELLLAYLLYSIKITKPDGGLQATGELLNILDQKWQIG